MTESLLGRSQDCENLDKIRSLQDATRLLIPTCPEVFAEPYLEGPSAPAETLLVWNIMLTTTASHLTAPSGMATCEACHSQ